MTFEQTMAKIDTHMHVCLHMYNFKDSLIISGSHGVRSTPFVYVLVCLDLWGVVGYIIVSGNNYQKPLHNMLSLSDLVTYFTFLGLICKIKAIN